MDEFRKLLRQRAASAKSRLEDPAEDWCFGVSSTKERYGFGLESCVAAARAALRKLNLVITGGDLRDTEARIDARSDLSELVRITVQGSESGSSCVSFSAGRELTQDGKHLVTSLREAFEWCLNEAGRKQS